MPQILRKSLTACDALAALPPTPRMNSRPPRARTAGQQLRQFLDGLRVQTAQDLGGFGDVFFNEAHVFEAAR